MATRKTINSTESTLTFPNSLVIFVSLDPVKFIFIFASMNSNGQQSILHEVEFVLRIYFQVEMLDFISYIAIIDLPIKPLCQLIYQIFIYIF